MRERGCRPGSWVILGGARAPQPSAGPVTVDRVEKSNAKLESVVEETWAARGPDGTGANLHVVFTRGVPAASSFDLRIFSAAEPAFYRVYRGDQVVDIGRSVNTGVSRVQTVELKAVGSGNLATALNRGEVIASTRPFYRRTRSGLKKGDSRLGGDGAGRQQPAARDFPNLSW